MKLTPYLIFNGQCKEAFEFYQQVLGGEIVMMQTNGDSPICDQMPPDWRDKIIHARLAVDDEFLMGSDAPPGQDQKAQGLHVALGLDDSAKGERIFNALAENGTVQMPFGKTFWADGFGMVVDRFGTPWMVNCERSELAAGTKARAVA